MNTPANVTYTPRYVTHKRVLLLVTLSIFSFGVFQIWTPLRLTLFGLRAKAEAVRVVKEKVGFPPIVLIDDAQIRTQLEPRDRSYVFWNEFRFQAADGQTISVRANVGSQLKPMYPLTDADGLPTINIVCYDADCPTIVIFPFSFSTWLAPAVLLVVGLVGSVISAMLLYWANKPIEVPLIATSAETTPLEQK
ncbi:MAG: hypothetical protein QM790_19480 [Nibricoccus sp.]